MRPCRPPRPCSRSRCSPLCFGMDRAWRAWAAPRSAPLCRPTTLAPSRASPWAPCGGSESRYLQTSGPGLPGAPPLGRAIPRAGGWGFTPGPSLVWPGLDLSGAEVLITGVMLSVEESGAGSKGGSEEGRRAAAGPGGATYFSVVFTGQRVWGPSTSCGRHPRPEQRWGVLPGPGWRV